MDDIISDVNISPALQYEITKRHLRGNMNMEVWLIPYSIVTSLTLLLVTVMIALKFLRRRSKSQKSSKSGSSRDEYVETDDSNERLAHDMELEKAEMFITNGTVLQQLPNGNKSRASSTSSCIKMSNHAAAPPNDIPAIPPPSYNHVRRQEKKQPKWLEKFEEDFPASNC